MPMKTIITSLVVRPRKVLISTRLALVFQYRAQTLEIRYQSIDFALALYSVSSTGNVFVRIGNTQGLQTGHFGCGVLAAQLPLKEPGIRRHDGLRYYVTRVVHMGAMPVVTITTTDTDRKSTRL